MTNFTVKSCGGKFASVVKCIERSFYGKVCVEITPGLYISRQYLQKFVVLQKKLASVAKQ